MTYLFGMGIDLILCVLLFWDSNAYNGRRKEGKGRQRNRPSPLKHAEIQTEGEGKGKGEGNKLSE